MNTFQVIAKSKRNVENFSKEKFYSKNYSIKRSFMLWVKESKKYRGKFFERKILLDYFETEKIKSSLAKK